VKDEGAYQAHKGIFEMDWQFDRPVMQDGGNFYKNGLFCEWSYIFDFDHRSLKVYRGFGKAPDRGKKDWCYRSEMDGDTFYVNMVADFDFEMFKTCCPNTLAFNLQECVAINQKKGEHGVIIHC
jgi:hypothetical protein